VAELCGGAKYVDVNGSMCNACLFMIVAKLCGGDLDTVVMSCETVALTRIQLVLTDKSFTIRHKESKRGW